MSVCPSLPPLSSLFPLSPLFSQGVNDPEESEGKIAEIAAPDLG
jgi:hypothetical protein